MATAVGFQNHRDLRCHSDEHRPGKREIGESARAERSQDRRGNRLRRQHDTVRHAAADAVDFNAQIRTGIAKHREPDGAVIPGSSGSHDLCQFLMTDAPDDERRVGVDFKLLLIDWRNDRAGPKAERIIGPAIFEQETRGPAIRDHPVLKPGRDQPDEATARQTRRSKTPVHEIAGAVEREKGQAIGG